MPSFSLNYGLKRAKIFKSKMAEVIPFRAVCYNGKGVPGADVVAPPYDIITPVMRKALYEKSPYNIVRIDAGAEMDGDNEAVNKYTRAKEHLEAWLREGVLVRTEKPSFYAYAMDYEAGGGQRTVFGFFGLVRLEELGNGIYPHECTHSKPKADRFTLMSACAANTSPIFSIYRSPARAASGVVKKAMEGSPYIVARDFDGALHRLWHIGDEASVGEIKEDLVGRAIYIADGHHRYETALYYRDIMREKNPDAAADEPFNYVLMFLANIEDDCLTILPAHRLVSPDGDIIEGIRGHFEIKEIPPDADITKAISGSKNTFGLYIGGRQYTLGYKAGEFGDIHPVLRHLDVSVLHDVVFKRLLGVGDVAYEMNAEAAKNEVDGGKYRAAFFLNPTGVDEVEEVALSLLRMPPKSTYFYPKVMTGFVINILKNSL